MLPVAGLRLLAAMGAVRSVGALRLAEPMTSGRMRSPGAFGLLRCLRSAELSQSADSLRTAQLKRVARPKRLAGGLCLSDSVAEVGSMAATSSLRLVADARLLVAD